MIELAVGAALVGAAAWMGRRRGGVLGTGSSNKPITKYMSDKDFVREYEYRAAVFQETVNEAELTLYEPGDASMIQMPLDCSKVKSAMNEALDYLRSVRVPARDSRIGPLRKTCSKVRGSRIRMDRGGQRTVQPETCDWLHEADVTMDLSMERLRSFRDDASYYCEPSIDHGFVQDAAIIPKIPLSGLGAAITPGMSNYAYALELESRAESFFAFTQSAAFLVDEPGKEGLTRTAYLGALDRLKKARAATKDPRMAQFIRACMKPGTTDPDYNETCKKFRRASRYLSTGHRLLCDVRASYKGPLPSVPLSGLDTAITPGMSDNDLIEEFGDRVTFFWRAANDASRDMYIGYVGPKATKEGCLAARSNYFRSFDLLKEARIASRHARMPDLVQRCAREEPSLRCTSLKNANSNLHQGIRKLYAFRDWEYPGACPKDRSLPTVPLSGAL